MNYILFHGSQARFANIIKQQGLIRDSSGVFLVNETNNTNFGFTLTMLLYHGISLESQHLILEQIYPSFSLFYKNFPDFLPALFIFGDQINELETKQQNIYRLNNTYIDSAPYYKVSSLGIITDFIEYFSITEQHIIKAESEILLPLLQGKGRFFHKLGTQQKQKKPLSYKIIDQLQIYLFCKKLSEVLLEENIAGYINNIIIKHNEKQQMEKL